MTVSPNDEVRRLSSGDAGDDGDDGGAVRRQPSPADPPPIDRELRRRLDEVFGDVLPRVTSDERDPGDRSGMDAEFYRANRPPHHNG